MNLFELKEKFSESLARLEKRNNYLAVEVSKLGYPNLTNKIKTAGVEWDDVAKKIVFMFNTDFAEKLNDDEFDFTVCHEAIHILNCHVFLIHDEFEKMKRCGKTNIEIMKFRKRFNIAADCCVNDSLVNLYKVKRCFTDEDKDPIIVHYGKNKVGTDCHDLTAMDVYYLIDEQEQQQNDNSSHDSWDSFCDPNGTLNKNFVDAIQDFLEDNIENSALSDEEAEKIDEIKENMKNSSDANVSKVGREAKGTKRAIDGLGKETLNWNKILYQFIESKKVEDVWTRPNKKLMEVYPKILLPSWKDKEKQSIFCAIDASGSIDRNVLKLFLSLVRNTPKAYTVECVTFDTRVYPYNMKSNDEPKGGGGTKFDIIEQYIQQNLKAYPSVVFCLTDGDGTPVSPKYPNRWCFLLYNSCNTSYCKGMKWFKIKEIMK